jgi:hypothetical protein
MIENYSMIIKRENINEIQEIIDQPCLFHIKVFFATQLIQYAVAPINLRRLEFKDQTMVRQ